MKVFGKSDIGLKRNSNQDCFDYAIVSDDILWTVVCDGMGGINGGDVASNLAAKSIKESLAHSCFENLSQADIENLLKKAIEKANFEIFTMAQNDSNLSGMGTTVVLVAIFNDKIHVAHVGDSRAYLIRKNEIKQLTIDHSMVQELLDEGEITHEEAKTHPNKNIITRALGLGKNVNIDYFVEDKLPHDTVIICTDGLTNYFEQNEILECFEQKKDNDLVNELVSGANERGGSDNITVVVLSE